jgi:hypothetical protein
MISIPIGGLALLVVVCLAIGYMLGYRVGQDDVFR